MGFLGGLFGRGRDRKAVTTDRCMDCGRAGGGHTDWCPSATVPRDAAAPASSSAEDPEESREDTSSP